MPEVAYIVYLGGIFDVSLRRLMRAESLRTQMGARRYRKRATARFRCRTAVSTNYIALVCLLLVIGTILPATAQVLSPQDWDEYDSAITRLLDNNQREQAQSLAKASVIEQLQLIEAGHFGKAHYDYKRAANGAKKAFSAEEYQEMRFEAAQRIRWFNDDARTFSVGEYTAIIDDNNMNPERKVPYTHVKALLALSVIHQGSGNSHTAQELAFQAYTIGKNAAQADRRLASRIVTALDLMGQYERRAYKAAALAPSSQELPSPGALHFSKLAYEELLNLIRSRDIKAGSNFHKGIARSYILELTRNNQHAEALRILANHRSEIAKLKQRQQWDDINFNFLKAVIAMNSGHEDQAINVLAQTRKRYQSSLPPIEASKVNQELATALQRVGRFEESKKILHEGLSLIDRPPNKLTDDAAWEKFRIHRSLMHAAGALKQYGEMVKHADLARGRGEKFPGSNQSAFELEYITALLLSGRVAEAEQKQVEELQHHRSIFRGALQGGGKDSLDAGMHVARASAQGIVFQLLSVMLDHQRATALKNRPLLEDHLLALAQVQLSSTSSLSEQLSISLGQSDDAQVAEWFKAVLVIEDNLARARQKATRDGASSLLIEKEMRTEIETRDLLVQMIKDKRPTFNLAAANSRLATRSDIQNGLRPNEALILLVPQVRPPIGQREGGELVVIAVTRDQVVVGVTLFSAGLQPPHPYGFYGDLEELSHALRCGLDHSSWQPAGAHSCSAVLGLKEDFVPAGSEALPFDLAKAHKLYKMTFGRISHVILGKKLLVVAGGPLAKLPLHVLVASKPTSSTTIANADWVVRNNSIAMLTAASVVRDRYVRKPSGTDSGNSPYVGIGNPLLTGEDGTDKSAWQRQTCIGDKNAGNISSSGRNVARVKRSLFADSGVADAEALRRQPPLPETAEELCDVSLLWGNDADVLGAVRQRKDRKVGIEQR